MSTVMASSNSTSEMAVSYKDDRSLVNELVREVLDGNESALETLYKRLYNQLCHLSMRVVRTREAAEEIVNDVFNKLWTRRSEINLTGSPKSYLFVSVRNQSLDYLRKYKKEQFNEDIDEVGFSLSNDQDPHDIATFNELYDKIQEGIGQLPPQCQRIFKMSREEGLKYKEIAAELGISIKTVETQMGRALKTLREYVF
ncbi:MAG: RNA polymerase sigma-70 factor [Cyclobacteriaceae bacterium]|nr:RNA polymerase sigma-70 factor [Cyclobacteriaceae bacterium HetDA_MAG_MS6]